MYMWEAARCSLKEKKKKTLESDLYFRLLICPFFWEAHFTYLTFTFLLQNECSDAYFTGLLRTEIMYVKILPYMSNLDYTVNSLTMWKG